jgi:hypothetical protein
MTNAMAPPTSLLVRLLSDTTFARGGGTPGDVDIEIEHDPRTGLPALRGKTIHGLLTDAWLTMAPAFPDLADAAARVLGRAGDLDERAILRIEDGGLDEPVQDWVRYAVGRATHPLAAGQILRALTDVRHQTARDRRTGAPLRTTLRATRVLLRGTTLIAPLRWLEPPAADDLRCLALTALAVRHGGLARSRGRGFLQVYLAPDLAATHAWAGLTEARG